MARIASGALPAIFVAHCARLGLELVRRYDRVHQAQLERARGGEIVGEEADLARLRPADQTRQVPGAAALRDDAALGEAGDELGVVGSSGGCRSRARGRGRSPRRGR